MYYIRQAVGHRKGMKSSLFQLSIELCTMMISGKLYNGGTAFRLSNITAELPNHNNNTAT